jgi:hypothetical protein
MAQQFFFLAEKGVLSMLMFVHFEKNPVAGMPLKEHVGAFVVALELTMWPTNVITVKMTARRRRILVSSQIHVNKGGYIAVTRGPIIRRTIDETFNKKSNPKPSVHLLKWATDE